MAENSARQRCKWPALLLISVCLAFWGIEIQEVHAASRLDGEFQSWDMVTLVLPLDRREKVLGYMEVMPWFGDQMRDVRILHLRPAVGYRVRDNVSLWQGYAWTPLIEPEFQNEHRLFQQLLASKDFKRFILTSRTRLEERFIEGADGMAWRGVHLTRIDVPFGKKGQWAYVLFDQVFVNLNSPAGGPQAGFDQNMAFAGIHRTLNERVNMDVGYMNHYIHDRSGPDTMNHALLVILNFELF